MRHYIETALAFRDDNPPQAVHVITDGDRQFVQYETSDRDYYCSHWCMREALGEHHDMPEADPFGAVVVHEYRDPPLDKAVVLSWGSTFDDSSSDTVCATCHDPL